MVFLTKIAENITKLYGESLNPKQLKDIAIDPRFQEAVADYMREIEDEKQIQIIDK